MPAPTPAPTPTPTPPASGTLTFDFAQGESGFIAEFAEYQTATEPDTLEFHSEIGQVQGLNAQGFLLSSVNRSDDVFMFLSRPIGGLTPNTPYRVTVSITFATNVPPGCVGIGGSPGEGGKSRQVRQTLSPSCSSTTGTLP